MIDAGSLLSSILDAVEAGVRQSLTEIANEARQRAPVRKLFKGGGRRRMVSGQIGVHNQTVVGKPYSMVQRVGRTPGGGVIRGAPNSAAPVTAPARGSGRTPIGGAAFRQVAREGNGFRLTSTKGVEEEILGRARGDLRRGRGVRLISREIRGLSLTDPSKRGRVKENLEYGGTLRDSIEVVGPFRTTEGVTGYVKAAAVEHGFNYAYAQEFGTAHNAPQPYLRPALRNQFRKITTTQRNAIRSRLERGSARMRLVRTNLTIQVTPTGSGLARLKGRLDQAGLRLPVR